jgi:hypothetical protein
MIAADFFLLRVVVTVRGAAVRGAASARGCREGGATCACGAGAGAGVIDGLSSGAGGSASAPAVGAAGRLVCRTTAASASTPAKATTATINLFRIVNLAPVLCNGPAKTRLAGKTSEIR